nr:replication initiation factor domain-containing protein [Geobacter grbiciae]
MFDVLSLPDHAKVTRLDIAFDSFDGAYTVEDVRGCLLRGAFGGTARHITGFVGFTREAPGQTLYVGSPKSDARLRIYDKASEQGIAPGQREGYADWTRFELQLRGDVAKVAYSQLLKYAEGIGLVASLASLFASYIRPMFYVASSAESVAKTRHNKKKSVACPLWLAMFSRFDDKRPKLVRKNPDLGNLFRYCLGAAAAMKVLRIAVSGFDTVFEEAIEEAAFKLKHEALLIDCCETDYNDMFEHGYNPAPLCH